MHDIQQNELKLKATSDKLVAAKAMTSGSADAQHDDQSRTSWPSQSEETNIRKLEEECAKLEDIISLHRERERAFRLDLNALEIPPASCDSDHMPIFHCHYAMKGPREYMQDLG